MAVAVEKANPKQAPTTELGADVFSVIPSWATLGGELRGATVDREEVSELRWPRSVRIFSRMRNDTQLSGLYRGTTLPIRRYVWGIDENGADPAIVDAVCRDFNLPTIENAWQTFLTGKSGPTPRARNRFMWDRHQADALRAIYYGHYYFELHGQVGDDLKWHPEDASARSPWTIGQIFAAKNGDLVSIKQHVGLDSPELEAERLVAYVFDQEPGDWTGRSMFRSCYREWLLKDQLLRVDLVNHRRAGGILLNEAPKDATPAQVQALGQLAAQLQVGGGGALPAGTNPVFIRGTGSDVIASVNRHDESMAREFLMMFMALGTSSSGGNRALAGSFLDWFAIAQEAVAIWERDTFQRDAINRYVAWNYGDQDYLPMLAFKRPEDANPLDALATAVNEPAGDPAQIGVQTPEGAVVPVAATRVGTPNAVVVDEQTRQEIVAEWAAFERWAGRGPVKAARPRPASPPAAAAADTAPMPLPDRPMRREPFEHEMAAQVNFAQIDSNWQSQATSLVEQWKSQVRAGQIDTLITAIEDAGGDLEQLASVSAEAAGADLLASHLRSMASIGAAEAVGEATRQGLTGATAPVLDEVNGILETRAAALSQLLASALSQAAANKAVQLSGGALTPAEVAAQVRDYIDDLSDVYLQDQFGGALSAAQNGGRLAAMDANSASRFYASELLDTNTCEPCAENDGREYSSADEAAADYPAGGFRDCEGGPRCRGTVVAVYDEAASSASEAGLARIERRLDAIAERPIEVHLHDDRTIEVPVHLHQAPQAPMQLTLAEGAIENHVHLPAPDRPRSMRAKRGTDGALEVTYEGDQQ